MHHFINFIIESGISLSVFGLLYYLFLRRETFLLQNRIFLFVAVLFSVILPWLQFRVYEPQVVELPEITITPEYNFMYAITIYGQSATKQLEHTISSTELILWAYSIGVLLFLSRFLSKCVQIYRLYNKGEKHSIDGVRIVTTDASLVPFSFLNAVYIPKNLKEKDGYHEILLHEMEHVRQHHSYDILIVELLIILQWCNPFVWLLKRAVHENHEFLADKAVLATGTERGQYKLLLLNQCLGETIFIASPFNYSLIKNRIKMMNKIKSHKVASVKYVLGLFIAAGLIVGFALENKVAAKTTLPELQDEKVTVEVINGVLTFKGKEEKVREILKSLSLISDKEKKLICSMKTDKENDISILTFDENKRERMNTEVGENTVFVRVEQMPQYPGGMKSLLKYIAENMQYPKKAAEKGIQGKVYLKFVVTKTGDVGEVVVMRSPHELLSQEAIRVVKTLPKFKPGTQGGKVVNVWYQMPLTFMLSEPAEDDKEIAL